MLSFDALLSRFDAPRRVGKEWRTRCPVHGDSSPSLDISDGHTGPVFQCRSHHCQTTDILRAVGLSWADVLPERNGQPDQWDAVHEYRHRNGDLGYRVYRRGSGKEKVIRQQSADGTWSLNGSARVPYRLPEITTTTVVIVEGEKCVDALFALGIQATCNVGGATNWKETDTAALKAAGVTELVILPDEDPQGSKHASVVQRSAAAHGLHCRVVLLPGLPAKGDVVDWLEGGHTADELFEALEPPPPPMLERMDDATVVIAEGQAIAEQGIPYLIDGIIPAYGMLGFMVAYAKVGKTTLGHAVAAAVATGAAFLDRDTQRCRVLVIAAEDPPEYTAYLARHLSVPAGVLTFARQPLQLNREGLERIVNTVRHGGYGFVLIASWQAVVSSLVKDENDNAGSVAVVEAVKQATRATGIPWLIDAHSGKGEDQADEADPTRAMRGASAAAGAADYLLSLRYADGPFSSKRRLSGKGRFVSLEPVAIDYDLATGVYSTAGGVKSSLADSTWEQIVTMGALDGTWATAATIGVRAGLGDSPRDISGGDRRRITEAMKDRLGVERESTTRGDKTITRYRRTDSVAYDA